MFSYLYIPDCGVIMWLQIIKFIFKHKICIFLNYLTNFNLSSNLVSWKIALVNCWIRGTRLFFQIDSSNISFHCSQISLHISPGNNARFL